VTDLDRERFFSHTASKLVLIRNLLETPIPSARRVTISRSDRANLTARRLGQRFTNSRSDGMPFLHDPAIHL